MADSFPEELTSVHLVGAERLFIYGTPEGLAEKLDANSGAPIKVEATGRSGRRRTIWLNPSTIAYFEAGPPISERGSEPEM